MKILVVKTHAIGDLLLVTPSIRALRSICPHSEISVLSGSWSAPILQHNPYINEIITFDDNILFDKKWGGIFKLVNKLRKKHFDLALIFQPSMKVRVMIYSAMIKKRVGLAFGNRRSLLTDSILWEPNRSRYIAENYLDLIRKINDDDFDTKLDLFLTDSEKKAADSYLTKKGIDKKNRLIGIAPGGGKNPRDYVPVKIWDKIKFVELINRILDDFDARILLFGGKTDADICRYIKSETSDKVIDTSGEVDLRQLMALIEKCDLLVTNDSAPVHFAVALKTPSIVIFGPTNSYSLLPDDPDHTAIVSPIECAPCYSNEGFPGCDAPCCMDYIDVEDVYNALKRKLS
jgi:heptosyltransferase-2